MPNWEEELYKQGRVTKVARNKEWGGEESGYKLSISSQQHFFFYHLVIMIVLRVILSHTHPRSNRFSVLGLEKLIYLSFNIFHFLF